MSVSATAIWHDVECGSYEADLPLWEKLAERCGGPVLELGCGTGRVCLHLARRGHRVFGLDRAPDLLEVMGERAAGLDLVPVEADACDFALPEQVALILAPMQLLQLLDGPAGRLDCLRAAASSLRPGGLLAAAIVEQPVSGFNDEEDVVPDAREIDGWVYSSLPIEASVDAERIAIRRLRKLVSPGGELERSEDLVELRRLGGAKLEAEAAAAGLIPAGRLEVPPTLDHVGSTVVLVERSS